MTNPKLTEKVKEILDTVISLEDDGACGDPECCGDATYSICRESLEKAHQAIMEAIRESVPDRRRTSGQPINSYPDGWNACREEMLRRLQ